MKHIIIIRWRELKGQYIQDSNEQFGFGFGVGPWEH
jgi:hypothetical protein